MSRSSQGMLTHLKAFESGGRIVEWPDGKWGVTWPDAYTPGQRGYMLLLPDGRYAINLADTANEACLACCEELLLDDDQIRRIMGNNA